jgi:hypothetical protein
VQLVTNGGHLAFGILWGLFIAAILVLFAPYGGLILAPLLLLLVPFALLRRALQKPQVGRPTLALKATSALLELVMLAIFVYLYNSSVLSYCPPQRRYESQSRFHIPGFFALPSAANGFTVTQQTSDVTVLQKGASTYAIYVRSSGVIGAQYVGPGAAQNSL